MTELNEMERRIYKLNRKNLKNEGHLNLYGEQLQATENRYFEIFSNNFQNLAVSLIDYTNKPITFNSVYLEWLLRSVGFATLVAYNGNVYVTSSKGKSFSYTENGFVNDLEPTIIPDDLKPLTVDTKLGENGYITIANKPFLYSTFQNLTDFDMIEQYARELAKLKTLEISNANKKIQTYVGYVNKGDLTALNIMNQLNNGVQFIEVDKSMKDIQDVINVVDLHATDFYASLHEQFKNSYNELLKYLGVGVPDEKKERRITDEIHHEMMISDLNANIYINSRQQALKFINQATGLNMTAFMNNLTSENDFGDAVEDDGNDE